LVDLNYMTTKTAAAQWNITQRRVLALCAEDRIDGLARVENIWLIPKDAQKPTDARTLRYANEIKTMSLKPFVKWAGGKGQLLECIGEKYPVGLGESINKYCEPFVGGGAVLFDVLSKYLLEEVYINDINAELITAYKVIKANVHSLIEILEKMQDEYHRLDEEGRKEYFYNVRDNFNENKSNTREKFKVKKAAWFIFLNRTCFNGLYRVNRKGQFNVPIGSYKKPLICDKDNLINISHALQNVTIRCGDYRKAAEFIDSKTFVYLDPPYRPLNKSSNFTAYTEDGFDDRAQIELAEFIKNADKCGAKIILSNSDPKNVDENDNFFDDLYAEQKIHRIYASRAINSKASQRGKISELLITNF